MAEPLLVYLVTLSFQSWNVRHVLQCLIHVDILPVNIVKKYVSDEVSSVDWIYVHLGLLYK